MNLYVGNLPYTTTEEDLQQMFSAYGTVVRATIVKDRETGRSKGFGFVQMASNEEGTAAMSALNGLEQNGRKLTVNEARPREEKPRFNRDR
jgi:RNA recognition motif-containing protein